MAEVPPIYVEFMLACYTSPNPAADVGETTWNSEAGREVRSWLLENELVDGNFKSTSKGAAWVGYICRTPLPVESWVLPPRSTEPIRP
jgi:hypothetical protein